MGEMYVAFDIERSGPMKSDETFAIGVAWSNDGKEIESTTIRHPLIKSKSKQGWEIEWKTLGWHMKTFEEFWSNHLDVLNDLFPEGKFDEMHIALNDVIEKLESESKKITYLFDTAHYDATYINMLLLENSKAPLQVRRDTSSYNPSIEVDSYKNGILDVDNSVAFLFEPQSHNPEQDARAILKNYFRLKGEFIPKIQETKKRKIEQLRSQQKTLIDALSDVHVDIFHVCSEDGCDALFNERENECHTCYTCGEEYCEEHQKVHVLYCEECGDYKCKNNSECKCACSENEE